MTMFDGSSALANQGISPDPVGTLEEVRKEGLDPSKICCCAPPTPGVRSCAVQESCQFHLMSMGGFKFTKGPKNVGYYLRTHEGQQKQDYMPCHAFVRVMQSRMIAGRIARQQNLPHETIRIIAQEGEKIRVKINRQKDPEDRRIDAPWETVYQTIEVPRLPRVSDRENLGYEQELWLQELERQKAEDGEVALMPEPESTEPWVMDEAKIPDVPLSEPEA